MLKNREGFTLVELMIVVAVIGVLAAIAIPNFLKFRLKSKTSEANSNLGAIRTTEIAYFAEWSCYVGGQALTPNGRTGVTAPDKIPWVANTRFTILGFAPEGNVFFSYSLNSPDFPNAESGFSAGAVGDLDGDGATSRFNITNRSTEIVRSGDAY